MTHVSRETTMAWTKRIPKEQGFYWYSDGEDITVVEIGTNYQRPPTATIGFIGHPETGPAKEVSGFFWDEPLIEPPAV